MEHSRCCLHAASRPAGISAGCSGSVWRAAAVHATQSMMASQESQADCSQGQTSIHGRRRRCRASTRCHPASWQSPARRGQSPSRSACRAASGCAWPGTPAPGPPAQASTAGSAPSSRPCTAELNLLIQLITTSSSRLEEASWQGWSPRQPLACPGALCPSHNIPGIDRLLSGGNARAEPPARTPM